MAVQDDTFPHFHAPLIYKTGFVGKLKQELFNVSRDTEKPKTLPATTLWLNTYFL